MNKHTGRRHDERWMQLLADRATMGLEAADARELYDMVTARPDDDHDGLERSAAAIHLALEPVSDAALPARLRDRILTDAGRRFGKLERSSYSPQAVVEPPVSAANRFTPRPRGRTGWYLAAAAVALAGLSWWQTVSQQRGDDPSTSQQYAVFLAETADVTRIPWQGREPGFENVSGEVLWSHSRQQGYMRFEGLRPNNPAEGQYQLWIVDPDRDQHPVDGGVFDVLIAREVIVPIDAKLSVADPRVFAITREKPGGVVVSNGPLLVVAVVAGWPWWRAVPVSGERESRETT